MQLSYAAVATENPAKSRTYLLASCLLTAGFLVRAIWAASVFLNADEAMHYVLSNQPSFALTYQATTPRDPPHPSCARGVVRAARRRGRSHPRAVHDQAWVQRVPGGAVLRRRRPGRREPRRRA